MLKATFGYLKMLRSHPPNERIWSEIQKIERLTFDYGEEAQPEDNVADIAENMQVYPPKRYLTGDDLLFDFQPELIKSK